MNATSNNIESDHELLRSALSALSKDAPTVGRRVSIDRGKHKGKSGVVLWHGRDAYKNPGRYEANWMVSSMRAARGKTFYRIRVRFDDGTDAFTNAEYATVIHT